jgi:hypothetical protein
MIGWVRRNIPFGRPKMLKSDHPSGLEEPNPREVSRNGESAIYWVGCRWLLFTRQQRDDRRLIFGTLLIVQDGDREPRNEDADSHRD